MKKLATAKDIITLPNPTLRQLSINVKKIDNQVLEIIEKMEQAALDWEETREHEVSVALAAVQIGILKNIVIIRSNFDDKSVKEFKVLINPKIVKKEGKIITDFEGCLSVKDIYGQTPRYNKVLVKAKNEKGQDIKIKAKGFLARVLQHEIDHSNGTVFVDHVKNHQHFYKLDKNGELQNLNYETEVKPTGILRD